MEAEEVLGRIDPKRRTLTGVLQPLSVVSGLRSKAAGSRLRRTVGPLLTSSLASIHARTRRAPTKARCFLLRPGVRGLRLAPRRSAGICFHVAAVNLKEQRESLRESSPSFKVDHILISSFFSLFSFCSKPESIMRLQRVCPWNPAIRSGPPQPRLGCGGGGRLADSPASSWNPFSRGTIKTHQTQSGLQSDWLLLLDAHLGRITHGLVLLP